MLIARFFLVLAVGTAGAAYLIVICFHWLDGYIDRHPVIYRDRPGLPVTSIRRLHYFDAVILAWLLSGVVWRITVWLGTEDPLPNIWPLPTVVLLVVAIRCARRIARQLPSGPNAQAGPQGSSSGGELVGTGGTTIGRGLLPLSTPTWPVLLVVGGAVVGAAVTLLLGE